MSPEEIERMGLHIREQIIAAGMSPNAIDGAIITRTAIYVYGKHKAFTAANLALIYDVFKYASEGIGNVEA